MAAAWGLGSACVGKASDGGAQSGEYGSGRR